MERIILILSILIFIEGCTSTMVNTFDGNLSDPYGFSGGTFKYLDQGADFVIEQRITDGKEQAQRLCGRREVYILGQERKTSSGVMSMPVTQTSQHQGTVSNGYDSANYSGTSTYTTYQSVPYTTVRNQVTFVCLDSDQEHSLYRIFLPENGAPICEEVPYYQTAGNSRLETVATAVSSTDCRKKGWLRYQSKNKIKAHLFIDDIGKQLCKEIEEQLIDKQIPTSEVNAWMRKNLKCKT